MLVEYEDLKIKDINDIQPKLIEYIEKRFRTSRHYRRWLHYLKEVQDLTYSPEYSDINFVENRIGLEQHHIITLYDITEIVLFDMVTSLKEDDYLIDIDVIKELTLIHLRDEVLVTPLSTTLHQLIHSRHKDIDDYDTAKVYVGNVKDFVIRYKDYLSDKQIATYSKYIDIGDIYGEKE